MSLRFGTPQLGIAIAFAAIAALLVAAFATVALSSRRDLSFERVHDIGYRLRRPWLALLVAAGVVVLGASFFFLPYARGSAAGRTTVTVRGGQFFWSIVPNQVPAGARVRFDVSSVDVNHGFGLYDPRGRLIGSVQAMPGYHNKLDLTLARAGTYQVRCLEFCGLNHAVMEATFGVVPAGKR